MAQDIRSESGAAAGSGTVAATAAPRASLDGLPALLARSPSARVYVDFDFTLFLSSSTEEFLDLGRPATLAALLLRALGALKPWALFGRQLGGTPVWRDPVRAWALILLMPWTLRRFERHAPALFERLQNRQLMRLLSSIDPARITIVSVGFDRFIRQLLRGSALQDAEVIASSLMRPAAVRRTGKLAYLAAAGRAPDRCADVVISDSLDDRDLLASTRHAYMIEPELDARIPSLQRVYVPFQYTARVKRSVAFVVKQMFLEEMAVVLLATAFFQPFSIAVWAGAALLFTAFLVVYEIGYAENDRLGEATELAPKLATSYEQLKHLRPGREAWYWAAALTAAGTLLVGGDIAADVLARLGGGADYPDAVALFAVMLVWLGIVAIGRGVFYVYNRLPTSWRVFAYVPLHFVKYFGLTVILPSQAVGYGLLYAQIVRTWSLYAIRRCGGDTEFIASQVVRLGFFLMILLVLTLVAPSVRDDWHTWVILGWCAARAIPEARRKLFSREALRSGLRKLPAEQAGAGAAPARAVGKSLEAD